MPVLPARGPWADHPAAAIAAYAEAADITDWYSTEFSAGVAFFNPADDEDYVHLSTDYSEARDQYRAVRG